MQLKTSECTIVIADFSIYFLHTIVAYKFLTSCLGPNAINNSCINYCKIGFLSTIPIKNISNELL